MTDLSILDTNLDEVQEPRQAPPGHYLATATNFKVDKIPNEKETPYADIEFRLNEALDGQDLTGVNLNRPIYGRIWLTADSLGRAKQELRKFGNPIEGTNLRAALEQIVGCVVKVKVDLDKRAADRGYDKRLVANWEPA